MGNSTGNFFEYWDTIYANPRLQGGYIWDWVDQGLTKTDPATGKPYWVYGTVAAISCVEKLSTPNLKVATLAISRTTTTFASTA